MCGRRKFRTQVNVGDGGWAAIPIPGWVRGRLVRVAAVQFDSTSGGTVTVSVGDSRPDAGGFPPGDLAYSATGTTAAAGTTLIQDAVTVDEGGDFVSESCSAWLWVGFSIVGGGTLEAVITLAAEVES